MFKVRTKFSLIILMLVLTFLTLAASTYAWFELNSTVVVDTIELTVSDGTLELSADGIIYKDSLDLNSYSEVKNVPKLYDLTSLDGKNITTVIGNDANKNKYLEITIHFRLTDVKQPKTTYGIYLCNYNNDLTFDELESGTSKTGTVIKSKGKKFRVIEDFYYDYVNNEDVIYKSGTEMTAYAEDALRLSFEDDELVRVFDLSENPSRGYNYHPNENEPQKDYGALSYFNLIRKEIALSTDEKGPEVITRDNLSKFYINEDLTNAYDNNSLVCVLSKVGDYYLGSTTLRVWIEGWDADCLDAIVKDVTAIQLEFCFANIKVDN